MQRVTLVGYISKIEARVFKNGGRGIYLSMKATNGNYWDCTIFEKNEHMYKLAEKMTRGTRVCVIGNIDAQPYLSKDTKEPRVGLKSVLDIISYAEPPKDKSEKDSSSENSWENFGK